MKRILRNISVLLIAVVPFVFAARGQNVPRGGAPVVTAVLIPDSISIGTKVTLSVEVEKDIMQLVDFPHFKEKEFSESIVLLEDIPADTVQTTGRRQRITKKYILTSYRKGDYDMGALPVLYVDKNIQDTIYSETALRLRVSSFPIDTVMNTVFDIKRPLEAPALAEEFTGYVMWSLLALCVLAAIIWLIAQWVASRKRDKNGQGRTKSIEPPHIRAIRELEKTHNQKLWQSGKHKLYYTRLSDILREYLDGRFGLSAMEMTSDEILSATRELELSAKSRKDLEELLRMADLVKFAKFTPDAEDNERVYYNAYYFVEETKEATETAESLEGNSEEEISNE